MTDDIAELEEEIEALESEIDEDENDDADAVEEQIYWPLHMLREVSNRLKNRSMPLNKTRLEMTFSHISGAVAELIAFAEDQIESGLEQVRKANLEAALESDLELNELSALSKEFKEAQKSVLAGLGKARDIFFSVSSFEDLEGQLAALELAEEELEHGLTRLDWALSLADNPELFEESAPDVAPEVPVALEALGEGVEALARHLGDGSAEHLEEALAYVEHARGLLERALREPPDEESETAPSQAAEVESELP